MQCKKCFSRCIKAGKRKTGIQKYRCRSCRKYQQSTYSYKAYDSTVHWQFVKMRTLGVGVLNMSRFLEISINTLQKWISKASCLQSDFQFGINGVYDIDELQTFVGNRNNKTWVCYGWNVKEKRAIGLHLGNRSSEALAGVVNEVLKTKPSKINTDNWPSYSKLIPKNKHKSGKRKANHIERQHVNLRKDIACLIRETICFSKKQAMLEARIRWYFWGDSNPYFFLK